MVSRVDLSSRRLGRETLIYGASFLVSRAAGFLMLPVYTRYLAVADYGILHFIEITLDVSAILLMSGITTGLMRFYFKGDGLERARVVATAFYLAAASGLTTGMVLIGLAPPLARALLESVDQAFLLRIGAINLALEPFVIVPMLSLQIQQRARQYALLSCVRLGVQISLNVVFLVLLGWGVKGPLVSTLLTNCLVGFPLTWWMLGNVGWRGNVAVAKDLLRFGIPYRLAQAGTFVLTFGDRYFLKAYHNLEVIGLYALAYKFGFLVVFLSAIPFLQAWNPQRFELSRQPAEVRDRGYNEGLRYFSLFVITVAVGTSLFVKPLLTIMSSPEYWSAAAVVPVLALAYAVQGWTDVVEIGIQVSERTALAGYATWCSVAVVLVLYSLLIPPLGALGAALATLVAFLVRFACYYSFSQRVWPVQYRWRPTLLLLAYGILSVIAAELLELPGPWLQTAKASLAMTLFALLACFGGAFSSSERQGMLAFLGQLVRRPWASQRGQE